jgi:hypothetical protein
MSAEQQSTNDFKREIIEEVMKKQQETEEKIQQMIRHVTEMMQQMTMTSIKSSKNETAQAELGHQSVKRNLPMNDIPELTSPVTAAKRTVTLSPSTLLRTPLPSMHHVSSHHDNSLTMDIPQSSSSSYGMSDSTRSAMQKGMAKPPLFDGNVDDKGESVYTWWRQVGNYASVFEEEARATVIKSFLRGAAAVWLDSRERELGRLLTVEELADGLSQEYGSETTSASALQKLETLSMASEGCSTISGYNTVFAKYYNLCSAKDQFYAARYYIKGILPKYVRHLNKTEFDTLAEAKAAVTLAVAKCDHLELAYTNYQQQKARGSTQRQQHQRQSQSSSAISSNYTTTSNNNHNNRRSSRRRWETGNNNNNDTFHVSLSSIRDYSNDDTENIREEGENEENEGQVAAVSSVNMKGRYNNNNNNNIRRGVRLTADQIQMLMKENRCFNCYRPGHRKDECRSEAATVPPSPLKGQAPSRNQ